MSDTKDLVRKYLVFAKEFDARQILDAQIDRCLDNGRIVSLGNRYKYRLPSSLSFAAMSELDLRDRVSFIRRLQNLRQVMEDTVKERVTESILTDDYSGYASPSIGFSTGDLVMRAIGSDLVDWAGIKAVHLPTVFPMFDWSRYIDDRRAIWRSPAYAGDTLLAKAYNEALVYALRTEGYGAQLVEHDNKTVVELQFNVARYRWYDEQNNDYFALPAGGGNGVGYLVKLIERLKAVRPNATDVWNARTRLLNEMNRVANHRPAQDIEQSFLDYWDKVKQSKRALVNVDEVNDTWAKFAVPVSGSASRTWGIEVEVVADTYISDTPTGWDRKGDGSLSPAVDPDNCDCSCDDCCDGEHYCGYDECSQGTTAEYVSPILRSTRSRGLNSLCSDLRGAPCNDTPGIHVHVGADNLTVPDLARLAVAYSAVSPFVEPLLHRNEREYCRDISARNVQHWLQVSRNIRRKVSGQSENPLDAMFHQPDSRYVDLNYRALDAHGTIEFRAMGPHYNYEHLIKWAWFCREMVNVSKLDLPTSTWTSCKSLADVLKVLTTYGVESELLADETVLSV